MIRHVGFILDGNRRFARDLLKRPWEGHRLGLEKARSALEWACDYGIKHITAYVLSLENLTSRPKRELAYILKYLEMETDSILKNADHAVNRYKIKVLFIGRTHLLPVNLQNKKHVLNVALAYGGQQEIVDAVKQIMSKSMKGLISPAQLNEQIIKEHLYTNGQPAPDLIIRTGGEKRLSNFLPFQSAYSELVFLDKRWPEMTKADFEAAVDEYDRRKRRFGA